MNEKVSEPASIEPQAPTPAADQKDANNWAMFCHLAALAALLSIPLGNILGPLVCWLIKKDTIPAVEQAGKDALNFQISMTIYGITGLLLIFTVIGIVVVPAVIVTDLVCVILAAVKASNGERFKYPLAIPFIK